MYKKIIPLLLLTHSLGVVAQENSQSQPLSLQEAITLARMQSVDAAVALNELKTAYWEYRTFRADLLPEVNFRGTLPNYNKSYSSYQTEDGSYKFIRNNALGLSGEVAIDQNIWFTGGKISLSSSLDYMQQLGSDGKKHLMSVPVRLSLTQPLFAANPIKWQRRISPVRYAEAKASFLTATEEVTMRTITYYFDLLLANENVAIAQQNLTNADKLYLIAQAKRKMGQISENELLQLKLSALKAKATRTQAQSNLNARTFALRSFLGMDEMAPIHPEVPRTVVSEQMNYNKVLAQALDNNPFAQRIRRRQLEADYSVAQAKGKLRDVNLFASVGYSGEDNRLNTVYNNLMNNQVVEVGITIPLLDWGKRRGNVKVAESNREVIVSRIKQDQMNFNQDIFLLVEQFNNQAAQLAIASEADVIAQQRYKSSIETFLIGKINTLDLNDAQLSKDESKQKHISELYLYWFYYYQLRSLTLYDYERAEPLTVDFEEVVR